MASFLACVIGSIELVLLGNASLVALEVGSALVGLGTASLFATGLLWIEEYLVISNRIGAAFSIAASLGCDVFPLIMGQFIDTRPMFLMYMQLCLTVAAIGCFGAAAAFVRGKSSREEEDVERDLMEGERRLKELKMMD